MLFLFWLYLKGLYNLINKTFKLIKSKKSSLMRYLKEKNLKNILKLIFTKNNWYINDVC